MLLFLSECFFVDATPVTEVDTLSLHDALPISRLARPGRGGLWGREQETDGHHRRSPSAGRPGPHERDRKSTRLNSSHTVISYAVFCLKKKTHLICVIIASSESIIPVGLDCPGT